MQGSLALHRGILYVGRHEKTAHVKAFDLDGRAVGEGFSYCDPRVGRSCAQGLAVDDDRHVWVADTPSQRVRLYTVFGTEIGGLGLGLDEDPEKQRQVDRGGAVREPVDVSVVGDSDGFELCVGSGGVRRHAVQVFSGDGSLIVSLRSGGHAEERFRAVRGVNRSGRWTFVAERGAQRVQVFRDFDFHFALTNPASDGTPFEATSAFPLEDGRVLVTSGGTESGLWLFAPSGRVLRRLAHHGISEGEVHEPNDVVAEEGVDDAHTRVAVIDRDGDRVQIFTVEGRCFGAFAEQAG